MKSPTRKNPTFSTLLKRIVAYVVPYKWWLVLALLLSLVSSVVWLAVPLGVRELLDAVFETADRSRLDTLTLILAVLVFVQTVMSFSGGYLLAWIGERIVNNLRKDVYGHLHQLDLAFFSNTRLGEITSRLTNDVTAIRNAVTQNVSELITLSIGLFGSFALMLYLNWRLTLFIIIILPPVVLISRYYGSKIRALSKGVQDRLADTTALAEETLGSAREVKSFSREDYEKQRYNDRVENLFETSRQKVLITNLFWSIVATVFLYILVAVFWYGGIEVLAGRLTAGDLIAFIFYMFNITRSMGGFTRIYTALHTATGASERVFELLDKKPAISDWPDAIILNQSQGNIRFENVSFSYNKNLPVLNDVNLRMESGERVAVVGVSGAGKTTLINLIPRFYDPTKGRILIDGTDIRQYTQRSLRSHIGLVSQDVHLFGSSIGENIRYGKLEATQEEIVSASKAAYADEFIRHFPDGYDTQIGERGVKLSGGQRQRIAIARVILKNPSILLLDEATSALDSESEGYIQETLSELAQKRTTISVAHRLSTISNSDRIIVLDAGSVAEQGSHYELMAQDGIYANLYKLQVKE